MAERYGSYRKYRHKTDPTVVYWARKSEAGEYYDLKALHTNTPLGTVQAKDFERDYEPKGRGHA